MYPTIKGGRISLFFQSADLGKGNRASVESQLRKWSSSFLICSFLAHLRRVVKLPERRRHAQNRETRGVKCQITWSQPSTKNLNAAQRTAMSENISGERLKWQKTDLLRCNRSLPQIIISLSQYSPDKLHKIKRNFFFFFLVCVHRSS